MTIRRIRFGKYLLQEDTANEKKIIIRIAEGERSGEAATFDKDDFTKLIELFYNDNF